jgi:hypothetical protein
MIMPDTTTKAFRVTERNRVRRLRKHGRHDKASIYPILDPAMICHVSHVIDGQLFRTPGGESLS